MKKKITFFSSLFSASPSEIKIEDITFLREGGKDFSPENL